MTDLRLQNNKVSKAGLWKLSLWSVAAPTVKVKESRDGISSDLCFLEGNFLLWDTKKAGQRTPACQLLSVQHLFTASCIHVYVVVQCFSPRLFAACKENFEKCHTGPAMPGTSSAQDPVPWVLFKHRTHSILLWKHSQISFLDLNGNCCLRQ